MSLRLTSPAFDDGEPIPERYGRERENVNPPLAVGGVPADAKSLVLVVDDPDAEAVAGKVWNHWLVWNVDPDVSEIPESWSPGQNGAIEGKNDYGELGYGGPNPPDRRHRYRFRLWALDRELALVAGATRRELDAAMQGHVLAEASLSGTYDPS
ncbi:YbhB/YbcL family Raf kinase inhibitor-like protein [Haloprofundus sp. MHR1]|uniref:YbhB/YbcL family Raf kinase inhibitor-like protein n=1 Tax=Haloprofundus sp. MHR1 TaxID=2572921 RepID=UPI0010BE8A65|nr:YbhB/YbcL family Raf kinase inhibitor-like protein [Haloprofundus sp. MHR1]QCJ47160.1 YbhB/YbcL family Raf kinase inhibitor-like protein [Haloprofundus sp. MHR1]